tara:strand:- start:249 stop:653 length:405 start_codon:yes stop_codon:yes gene_type:complete
MAHSLEVRVPFLDHNIVEYGLKLRTKDKINFFTEKYNLKKAMKNKLPKRIINRPKRGFSVPINMWLKEGIVDDLLDNHNSYQNNFVPSDYFNKAVKKIKSSSSDYYSNYFYSSFLWSYFIFDKWIDKNKPNMKK